jgi:5-methyltetrahydropteroyltriglutamate--homocysteine methyltransferase
MAWERFFDRYVSSHVGSLPLEYSPESFERAFRDLAAAGLDVPPVPQLRDFVSMYLQPLADAGVVEASGTIFKARREDLEEAAKVRPKLPEFEMASKLARELGVKRMRVPVTGAFTLASRVYVGDPSRGMRSTALADRELVADALAGYVANAVRAAAELPGAVVVIDEPVLGTVVGGRVTLFGYRDEDILEAYARELKPAAGLPRGTHVCGQVNERLASLLAESENLDFLNHEFHDTPTNLSIPWRRVLERGDKFLSPGVFSTKRAEVESVGEMLDLATRILEAVGPERVNLFSGDCGLGGLRGVPDAYRVALAKLRNLAEAVRALNERSAERG